MNQVGLFGAHVRADLNVEAPEPEDNPQHFVHALRRLWTAATGIAPGPVHVNLRFRKPLWRADSPDVETPPVSPTEPRPHWPPRPTSNVWCATPGATAASSWLDPTPEHASTLSTSVPSQTSWGGPSSLTRSASFATGPTFLPSTTTTPCCACRHFATHTPTRWPSVSGGRAARGRSKNSSVAHRASPSTPVDATGTLGGASRGRSTHRSAAWLHDSLNTLPSIRIRGGSRRGSRATGAPVRSSAPFVQTDSGKEVSLTTS